MKAAAGTSQNAARPGMVRAPVHGWAGEAVSLLKVLAHPARLQLVLALAEREFSVGELERRLGIRQPTLSQQLTVLREAGVVVTRRDSRQIFYRLEGQKAVQLVAALQGIIMSERD